MSKTGRPKLWNRSKVRKVDEYTWNFRVNDHVLIEWVKEPGDAVVLVDVLATIGPYIINSEIRGAVTRPLGQWELDGVTIYGQCNTDLIVNKEFLTVEYDVGLPVGKIPDLYTWLKMAHERGAFQ